MPSLLDAVEGHAETGISFGQASDDDRENHRVIFQAGGVV